MMLKLFNNIFKQTFNPSVCSKFAHSNNDMRRIVIVLLMIGFMSCETKEKQWSQAEINAKVDSAVNARTADIRWQAMEDLDSRMAIEVKAKADSIVQSHEIKLTRDTTATKKK